MSGVWYIPSGDGAQEAVSVSFVVDGTMVESKEIKLGGPVEEPAVPSKTGSLDGMPAAIAQSHGILKPVQ